jgi:GntR family transcriptional repressor for pyruvate dehydrogenase complex
MIHSPGLRDSAFAMEEELPQTFEPMPRERLPDRLARRIRLMIQSGARGEGDRLPAIGEMARRFGVGHQSVREALKKLETMGVVEIRHGSGVYVCRHDQVVVLTHPDHSTDMSEKAVLDLLRARMPLEVQSVIDAAHNATIEQTREMRRVLAQAAGEREEEKLNVLNVQFHRLIVVASGNSVLIQLVDVLHELFGDRQRQLLGVTGSLARDHEEHVAILEAIEAGDETLASARMQSHLQGVYDAVQRSDRRAVVARQER